MEKDLLNKNWESSVNHAVADLSIDIIKIAKKQRNAQLITLGILSTTVLIIVIYASYYAMNQWTSFNTGLLCMILSLVFRIVLEFFSILKKENNLISLDHKAYRTYLKKYYRNRMRIHYVVTPFTVCVYIFGFVLLLPYFKAAFSTFFYTYLIISGVLSMLIIIGIIINSIVKEQKFLNRLNRNDSK